MHIIDTHADTLLALSRPHNPFTGKDGPMITPERLRAGGVTLQVCALFAGSAGPSGTGENAPAAMAEAQLLALRHLTDAGIPLVKSPFDAKEGEPAIMLSIEGGEIIGDSIETLYRYHQAGVRLFSLTWNHENLLAYPHIAGHRGLKPFGWEVVKELNRLHIAVDVAHLGEGGFWDLMYHSDKPPMTSHSCCRALRNHTRNLTDDQIRALIEKGGWMGINFYLAFLTDKAEGDVDTVIDHICHVAELGGIGHVGFGSDFDGIDRPPTGLSHAGEMPGLIEGLRRRGFTDGEVCGIAGENFLQYMRRLEA